MFFNPFLYLSTAVAKNWYISHFFCMDGKSVGAKENVSNKLDKAAKL
jgi:hypothetical protein